MPPSRFAPTLERAAEERAAAAGGYLWQTEVVGDGYDRESGTPHFDAVLNQRERDGWELVGMVREDLGTTRLVYRREKR